MDEADVQQRARSFIAPLDLRNIRDDLSVYLNAANAILRKEEMEVGESGMLSYEHNSRLRSLGEEVLKDTSSAVKLLVTTDGEVYRFVRGMVDQTAVLLKRIS